MRTAAEARMQEGSLSLGVPRLPGLQELAWTLYMAEVVGTGTEMG